MGDHVIQVEEIGDISTVDHAQVEQTDYNSKTCHTEDNAKLNVNTDGV